MLRWTAATAACLFLSAVVIAPPAQAAGFTPDYGTLSGEPADSRYAYRAMPALHRITWTENGVSKARFVRSFQDGIDDGSLKTRIQYHVGDGASLTNSANWLDARSGTGTLRDKTQYAKVNNVFRASGGTTVTLDEKVANGKFGRHETADGGVTWTSTTATVDMGTADADPIGGRAFQRIIRLPGDGSLVMPYYADRRNMDKIRASHLLVSEPSTPSEGSAWRHAATVFHSDTNSYTESTVTRLATGKLLMISRYDVVQNGLGYARLAYRVTKNVVNTAADLRATGWEAWTSVTVPGTTGSVRGVAPLLNTMDGGVLMLTYGRPGNNVTFSHDGGKTWDAPFRLYSNIPANDCPSSPSYPCDSFGSSGYMGIAVTSGRSAYVLGDNCQAGWGCKNDTAHRYPNSDDNRLWFRVLSFS